MTKEEIIKSIEEELTKEFQEKPHEIAVRAYYDSYEKIYQQMKEKQNGQEIWQELKKLKSFGIEKIIDIAELNKDKKTIKKIENSLLTQQEIKNSIPSGIYIKYEPDIIYGDVDTSFMEDFWEVQTEEEDYIVLAPLKPKSKTTYTKEYESKDALKKKFISLEDYLKQAKYLGTEADIAPGLSAQILYNLNNTSIVNLNYFGDCAYQLMYEPKLKQEDLELNKKIKDKDPKDKMLMNIKIAKELTEQIKNIKESDLEKVYKTRKRIDQS